MWGLARHVHCGRLNEASATWNHAAVKRSKAKLGLEMVTPSIYTEDAVRRCLLIYQGLGIGHW